MKTVELMDYEFSGLLDVLRESLHQQTTLAIANDPYQLHGFNAHLITHLLEVLQPKHAAIPVPVSQDTFHESRTPVTDHSLSAVLA